MRKRVVIGVVALVIGGIAAFVFRPWESPIEYHKRAYLSVRNGGGLRSEMRAIYCHIPGRAYSFHWWKAEANRHQKALVELGYLEERTVVVSNRPSQDIVGAMHPVTVYDWHGRDSDFEFLSFQVRGPNVVSIIAVKKDAPRWEQAVRDADVPQNGK